ncbi:MAG: DHH family phosphoesterase [Porticoccaceae bacterium]
MNTTTYWDVFNGDADGICALLQLRLAEPKNSQLVTGIKRDIELLDRVAAESGDQVTVLDVSLDKNRDHLERILDTGAHVFYVDHHFSGDIPNSSSLNTLINQSPDVCTSLLINQHIRGAYQEWAIVGAFGDNLKKSAHGLAKSQNLSDSDLAKLERLGILINYNGYGATVDDLHYHPADLFNLMLPYKNPLDFISDCKYEYETLENGYDNDFKSAENADTLFSDSTAAVYVLPDEAWARRVSGVFGNHLANLNPDRGHAILTNKADGNFLVSVRAPLSNKKGAADLCRKFPTGGGREAAAGINDLPKSMVDDFIAQFREQYS